MSGTMPDKTPSGEPQSRRVISTGYAAFSNFIGVLSGFGLSPPRARELPGNRPAFARPVRLVQDVRVAHRCLDVSVPEQFLNDPDVVALPRRRGAW